MKGIYQISNNFLKFFLQTCVFREFNKHLLFLTENINFKELTKIAHIFEDRTKIIIFSYKSSISVPLCVEYSLELKYFHCAYPQILLNLVSEFISENIARKLDQMEETSCTLKTNSLRAYLNPFSISSQQSIKCLLTYDE